MGDPHIMDPDKVILKGYFGNAGDQGMVVFGERDTQFTIILPALGPAGHPGDGIKHPLRPRRTLQVPQPEFQGIGSLPCSELVDERFHCKLVGSKSHRHD